MLLSRVYKVLVFAIGFILSASCALAQENAIDPTVEISKDFVYVCKDGGAGGYEAFPDVCRLADGRLLCVFYAGYGHVAFPNEKLPKGGRISGCYSSDEGKTWSDPVTMVDTPVDDRDPSITQMADGRLLLTFFTYERIAKKTKTKTYLAESTDAGKTWSQPRKLFEDYPCSTPIRVLSDGTLVFPLYGFQEGEQRVGAIALSHDQGTTWSEPICIPNGGVNLDAETDVIELKNGDLWAIQRPQMAWSVSKDKGKTWSKSEAVGFEGHCPYLLRVDDHRILMATRCPVKPASTALYLSTDECQTWSKAIMIDTFGGAYPSMVKLKDGTILIVYYEEGAGSSIRARTCRVL
ncbi:MAG: sialidase family protein [Thermoguttaceae bacterium]|nr:sialidase family protein [Thermoguttaceae bacterium]